MIYMWLYIHNKNQMELLNEDEFHKGLANEKYLIAL